MLKIYKYNIHFWRYTMKKYKVILTESEMRKLNEVRRNDDEFITVDHIDKSNYKKYIGQKVNVTGDVNLQRLYLRKVDGDFYCYHNRLTSLSGCPSEVGENFDCDLNNLTSLAGCPHKVGWNFDCSSNELTSLKSCPSEVNGDFDCSNNKLISLKGCPRKVGRDFDCLDSKLTSLIGCPTEVGRDFNCEYNNKEFTENDVQSLCKVGGSIYV